MVDAKIRCGIGGWTFKPWRGAFYPKGLRQADELSYAASKLSSIEINGTYYRTQTPGSFAKWGAATPDGFQFAVKASRYCTNRKFLPDAKESMEKFFAQEIEDLGDRLGPILWQFMPTKKFDAAEVKDYVELFPKQLNGIPVRHVMEARHESFRDDRFFHLLKDNDIALVNSDSDKYPKFSEQTASFAYLRLLCADENIETGYAMDEIAKWSEQFSQWRSDGRDVYVYFINGAKVRAPAAAMALMEQLGD